MATRAAQDNLVLNEVDNVAFARLAAEEVTQALNGDREFRRLKSLDPPLNDYDLATVFVDPPARVSTTARQGSVKNSIKFFMSAVTH